MKFSYPKIAGGGVSQRRSWGVSRRHHSERASNAAALRICETREGRATATLPERSRRGALRAQSAAASTCCCECGDDDERYCADAECRRRRGSGPSSANECLILHERASPRINQHSTALYWKQHSRLVANHKLIFTFIKLTFCLCSIIKVYSIEVKNRIHNIVLVLIVHNWLIVICRDRKKC